LYKIDAKRYFGILNEAEKSNSSSLTGPQVFSFSKISPAGRF
jgi:hypothetical protein